VSPWQSIASTPLELTVIGFEPFIGDDDEQAVEKAKQLLDGHELQIWSGPRYVRRLDRKEK
jgi:hypothetical protein